MFQRGIQCFTGAPLSFYITPWPFYVFSGFRALRGMRGILSLPLAFLAGAALTSSRLAAFDALHIALCAVGAFRPRPTAVRTYSLRAARPGLKKGRSRLPTGVPRPAACARHSPLPAHAICARSSRMRGPAAATTTPPQHCRMPRLAVAVSHPHNCRTGLTFASAATLRRAHVSARPHSPEMC
jgi:hypothetical protein